MKGLGSGIRVGFIVACLLTTISAPAASTVAAAPGQESICTLPEDERPEIPPEPVELCATTIFSGTEPGVIRIRVLEETRIARTFGSTGGMSISSDAAINAKFAGLALVAHVPDRGPGSPMFFGGRFNSQFGGGTETTTAFIPVDGNDLVLAAGNYLLYLLADGEPLAVTLRPRGPGLDPEGWVEISPRRPMSYQIRSLTPRVSVDGARHIYSAGDTGEITDSMGLLFQRLYFRATNHVTNIHAQCAIQGDPEDRHPSPIAYAPGCPNGGAFNGPVVNPTPPLVGGLEQRMFHAFRSTVPGTWGMQSWWSTVAQEVTDHGALGIWLSFDE